MERGLRLPIVYNTSAYDSLESLAWLDGIEDIYMRRHLTSAEMARARQIAAELGLKRLDRRGVGVL